jgi:hypothetical protein
VLLLHRHLDHGDVLAGITAALSVGSTSADVVAVEARKAAGQRDGAPASVSVSSGPVVSLTERRLAALPGGDRPLPTVEVYDGLLRRESS